MSDERAKTWEPVCGSTTGDTWCMRVEGGWIYRYDRWTQDENRKVSSRCSAMVFVPDPAATTEPQKPTRSADRR
jgi:hypothetical protein